MRRLRYAVVACILAVGLSTTAHAGQTTNDEVFANAALRNLHALARATAQYAQATRDSDQLGCHDAYVSMQKAAHEALVDMHSMSFGPEDAIRGVSALLRLGLGKQDECPSDFAARLLLVTAGVAIVALRYDYSIGDGDWYTVTSDGTIEAKNPLRYARSLKDQSYSWVTVMPKDAILPVLSDWKAELFSLTVDDPLLENSGTSLMAVEVDYGKGFDGSNTKVYFYRTKEAAKADSKASKAEWSKKLTSLPYMIANHYTGFKLVYDVCRDTGEKDANGIRMCADDGSHDWSDDRGAPYRWFSDMQSCEDAQFNLGAKKPADVKINRDDAFGSACVPAPKVNGHVVRGYKIVFALVAPGAYYDDALYAALREQGSNAPIVFKTFQACYDAGDPARLKALTDLGADEDGYLLGDKTKSIGLTANCVRVY